MDLIDKQAAIDALADMHCKSDEDGYVWIIRSDAWARIDALPSVTPKQKRGKWIIKDDTERFIAQCNCCRYIEDSRRIKNYCPNCGARMTEEER